MKQYSTLLFLSILLSISCGQEQKQNEAPAEQPETPKETAAVEKNPNKNLYWGDTHLHTYLSPDAFANGNRLTPDETYRFAKGQEITATSGIKVKLSRPLDFLVIADHAEGFGIANEILSGNEILMRDPILARWRDMFKKGGEESQKAGAEMPVAVANGSLSPDVASPRVIGPILMKAWRGYIRQAEAHYQPGVFTSLIGYEWSSMPGGDNIHRVVVYRDGGDKASKVLPFSSLVSNDPEALWAALKSYEEQTGGKALAIPHNGNLSNGRMFPLSDFNNNPITQEYAKLRASREPLVETTQYKGDSESHPLLSPNDEFASFGDAGWDFGNMTLAELKKDEMLEFEYSRGALKNGILMQEKIGANPYKFGMIGSTDSHTGMSTADEDNWLGKFTHQENDPERALKQGRMFSGNAVRKSWQYLSSGYAAVWAESNTREDIWDAMKRKEVYGTTGPRIQLRFFGGWDYQTNDVKSADYASVGYQKGVPMGGDLTNAPAGKAPVFMIAAAKDPLWANLDRVQIIKGWIAEGKTYERIYNVAWAGARELDGNGKLPAVGNTVDAATASYSNDIGAAELATVWIDPDFDASQNAFYYVRVLEIPTPRWTTYDAVKYDITLPDDVPVSIQERAYSSPIWYTSGKQ